MPKNMKYDATTKKAGASKKMKSNQDGGSVNAKDPAAAGKELVANQKGAAKYKKGPAMGHKKGPAKKKPDANKNGVPDYAEDGVGASRMGYSQKFGAGRKNCYQKGAAKVAKIMKGEGAAKYMAEGPAQDHSINSGYAKNHTEAFRAERKRGFDAMNERLRINKDEARTQTAIAKQRNITSMQADVKDGTRPGFSSPSTNPIDGMTYSYGARLLKGGDKMIDQASSRERNVTRGADGYYTADAFPRNRRSAKSREEFTGTYGRQRGQKETPNKRGSFDYAKNRYEQNAQIEATRRNRIINEFKGKVGIDVNREAAAAVQNRVASIFNGGIGSVKNSTAKNPTGLKSYKTKEIN
jgi:hypothetical protein